MKKNLLLLFLLIFCIKPVFAQQINIDSIVKAVVSRNPRKANNYRTNNDSLYKRLPFTKAGPQRVKLIIDLFSYGIYPELKQNIDMGYKILGWSKAHHDLIAEAVIAAELGGTVMENGDKATSVQLQTEAMAAAKQANDAQTLGMVYEEASSDADFSDKHIENYILQGLKFSYAAKDTLSIGWGYYNQAVYFNGVKKPDSALFYAVKSLQWMSKTNRIDDICNVMDIVGYFSDLKHLNLHCLKGAFAISELTNNIPSIPNTAGSLADYYFRINQNLDSALFYAYKAYNVGKHLTIDHEVHWVNIIGKVYTQKRNIDSAVKYIRLYYTLNEQLNNNAGMVRAQAFTFNQQQKQQQAEADKVAAKNTQQLWMMALVIAFLLLIAFIFWRNNRLSRKANALLAMQKLQTERTLAELKSAQTQLIQSEKMASLGELTAGIAHEIQNPLNFVNNFSDVNREMIDELEEALKAGDNDAALAIAADIKQNEEKIIHHGKRADFIVKGMLQHSRTSTGEKQLTNINTLADEFLKLSYHGLRAKDKSFNAELATNFAESLPKLNLVQQDIGRVLLNLFNNAFYAVNQKQKTAGPDFKPEIVVSTTMEKNNIIISVKDNGNGIPDAIKEKIMQPFFTTKPAGEGTGLGLSLSYDIVVKGHGGKIEVRSVETEGSEFIILLPNI